MPSDINIYIDVRAPGTSVVGSRDDEFNQFLATAEDLEQERKLQFEELQSKQLILESKWSELKEILKGFTQMQALRLSGHGDEPFRYNAFLPCDSGFEPINGARISGQRGGADSSIHA